MNKAQKMMLLSGEKQYWQRIKSLFGSSLVAYWPLWETSGTVIHDISGNGRDFSIVGDITPAGGVSPTGYPCPLFAGGNIPVFNQSFSESVGGAQVSIAALVNSNSAVYQVPMQFFGSGGTQYRTRVEYNVTADTLLGDVYYQTNDGVAVAGNKISCVSGQWQFIIFVRDEANELIRYYVNGVEQSFACNYTWEGTFNTLAYNYIGSSSAGTNPFLGNMSDVMVINRAISSSEAINLSKIIKNWTRLSVLGDSIPAYGGARWPALVGAGISDGYTGVSNHSAGGASVMLNMDTQTVAAASDNADIIIISLGTNDDNAGNMATLQAEYAENIAELKASNPRATIYAMNVLPKWTDVGGGTEVDKANIRTAIAAACTAQGIVCWDTYTTPWIDAGDTSDGTHPTAAGHIKIATQVLARL